MVVRVPTKVRLICGAGIYISNHYHPNYYSLKSKIYHNTHSS
jgi:hypothetical protein